MDKITGSPGGQSVFAGFMGYLAYLDDCAALLACVVLLIQVSISLHRRKTAMYTEEIAKSECEKIKTRVSVRR